MSHPLAGALRQGLLELSLSLDEAAQAQLLAYMDLIAKWTKVYNLTAVRDAQEMLTHHLLDSLAAVAPLRRELAKLSKPEVPLSVPLQATGAALSVAHPRYRLLDVGAGAGLPGVVIAITCPDVSVTCVDTVAKKAAFVQQVAASLRLPNLRGLHARVETVVDPFDVVCSRAFASLVDFTTWSTSALAPHGVWLAMKGKHPEAEIQALPPSVKVFHVEPLTVPGLDAERCIVWMRG
ncbi:16S rRNA (guanine(527)-N(7))-methyltransferase RsmG [Limnohabitans sp.]|uniref:16S rRNA (guanine(527)-N(7))-methyltransferase RsmG n=1 Tax=Limnohabitans sp. TaxID=1907725 RepID=UPI0038BB99FA